MINRLAYQFAQDWVGVPYVENGRDKTGIDCIGLVIRWLELRGIIFPDYLVSDTFDKSKVLALKELHKKFQLTSKPQAGDIVLFRDINGLQHTGIILMARKIVHATKTAGVVISKVDSGGMELIGCYAAKNG